MPPPPPRPNEGAAASPHHVGGRPATAILVSVRSSTTDVPRPLHDRPRCRNPAPKVTMLSVMGDVAFMAYDSLNREEFKAAVFHLRAVARSSKRKVLRRIGSHRGWSLPRGFHRAEDIEQGTVEGRRVVDVHVVADHGEHLGWYLP